MRQKWTATPVCCSTLISLLIILTASSAFASDKPEIRILLDDAATTARITGVLAWSSEGTSQGSSRDEVILSLVGDQVNSRWNGKSITSRRLAAVAVEGHLHYGGRQYRGRLEFFASRGGGFAVLNVLPLEEYLLGVVAAEMPSSWPAEALRAQAVAARSYAVTRMASRCEATYDILATTSDQVYKGVSVETPQTSQAVRDTAGEILTYNGEPIVAYFCADAGGYTRAGEAPYLRSVPCPSPQSPHSHWTFELSSAELAELAAAAGSMVGVVNEVTTRHDPVSGHLLSITLCGNLGTCLIDGPRLRRFIGRDVMKSTRARFTPLENAEVITGGAAPIAGVTDPAAATANSYITEVMEGYYRPWVATREHETGVKLRQMYAFDGITLTKCNRPVHAFVDMIHASPDTAPASPSAAVTTIRSSEPLGGLAVSGSGYGHGLGLSQWGAKQLAEDGWGYRDIVFRFFSGTELVVWNGILPSPPNDLSDEFYRPFRTGVQTSE